MASGHRSLQVKLRLLRSPFQVPRYPASKSSGWVCESELPVSSLAVLAGTASGGQVPATSGAASGPGSEAHSAEFHCHVRVPSESGVGWATADLQGASPRMTMGGWRPGARAACQWRPGRPSLSGRCWQRAAVPLLKGTPLCLPGPGVAPVRGLLARTNRGTAAAAGPHWQGGATPGRVPLGAFRWWLTVECCPFLRGLIARRVSSSSEENDRCE